MHFRANRLIGYLDSLSLFELEHFCVCYSYDIFSFPLRASSGKL